MNRKYSRRVLAALGVGVALSFAVGAASFGAQTGPSDLPAIPPQTEAPAQDRAQAPQQDRQLDRRDGGQLNRRDGGLSDRRGGPLERRLDFLHERLRITAAQERVWDDFANVVRDETQAAGDRFADLRDQFRGRQGDGRRNDGRRDDGRRGQPSVVERLEQRQQRLANQSARVDHLLSALRPLYAALNANQKQIADQLFFRPGADGGGFFNRRVPGPGSRFFDRFDRRFDRNYF
jgi:hypothetical protein